MTLMEAVMTRTSQRRYLPDPISAEQRQQLQKTINQCCQRSGLRIQLICDHPAPFDSFIKTYGMLHGVRNYLILAGERGDPHLDEKCGYYGERLVLLAQMLGLNTCWVAMTYSKIKTAFTVDAGEKLCVVISLGYGKTQGTGHGKSKTFEEVTKISGEVPAWFRSGVEAALLAPTAMNQQKFLLTLSGSQVTAKAGVAFYSKVDLGIVKYHFELGAGKENFSWA